MGSSLYLHMFLILCCCSLNVSSNSYSSTKPLCHEDERSALLQFKESFLINEFASVGLSAYPKAESWKLDGNIGDCCLWDGVECDHHTGHVVGLDLRSSFLYGSINSNSSLFSLVHLQRLNLADNHFNYSHIPASFGNLSRLRTLNLHNSFFSGQIPSEISSLSKLTFLDLSRHIFTYSTKSRLKLEKPSLRDLLQNLTSLKVLDLSEVNISSTVPGALLNMTSLTNLSLMSCFLYGEFPMGIFRLPNLRMLQLALNENLIGYLPEFSRGSQLEELTILGTSFFGMLPISIGNLESLKVLELSYCNLYGMIPPSVGNLAQLMYLEVAHNNFWGQIPTSIANLSKLTHLGLSGGTFDAEYFQKWNSMKVVTKGNSTYMQVQEKPRYIEKGKGIYSRSFTYSVTISNKGAKRFYEKIQSVFVVIDLSNNKFSGEIPESLGSLSGLQALNISKNNLTGAIPSALANLKDLESLDLSQNLLSGEIPQELTKLTFLSVLDVSYNRLTGPIPQGKQFATFDNSSYDGNMGLCGVPLTMLCGNSETSLPPPPAKSSQGNDLEFPIGIYWMVIIMGYGSGLIVGLVIGHTLTTKYHERFVAIFERGKKTKKMQKRKGRRH